MPLKIIFVPFYFQSFVDCDLICFYVLVVINRHVEHNELHNSQHLSLPVLNGVYVVQSLFNIFFFNFVYLSFHNVFNLFVMLSPIISNNMYNAIVQGSLSKINPY